MKFTAERISIPTGTIKSFGIDTTPPMVGLFQFQLVRLKADLYFFALAVFVEFQFQLVRLKAL